MREFRFSAIFISRLRGLWTGSRSQLLSRCTYVKCGRDSLRSGRYHRHVEPLATTKISSKKNDRESTRTEGDRENRPSSPMTTSLNPIQLGLIPPQLTGYYSYQEPFPSIRSSNIRYLHPTRDLRITTLQAYPDPMGPFFPPLNTPKS